MAAMFFVFWVGVATMMRVQRRAILVVLVSLKILAYPVLFAVILSGAVPFDAAGFSVGVSCFLIATIATTCGGFPPYIRA